MFTRFKKEHKRLFLDPFCTHKPEIASTQMLELVLSPALYWVKKAKLPVKSVREVKKLLPSLFEDLLPAGNYSYHAYKSGDEFLLFAYEEQPIFELLGLYGVAFTQIASVHFAQSLSAFLEQPKRINEKQALLLKDELVIISPLAWVHAEETLEMEGLKLPANTIRLQQYGHIVSTASINKIAAVLVLLGLIVVVEIFVALAKREEIVSKKEELFAHYKLKATMMQNRSLLESYLKINKEQKLLRETMGAFLALKLQGASKISRMEYKNRVLRVILSDGSEALLGSLRMQLEKKGVAFTHKLSKTNLTLEVKI